MSIWRETSRDDDARTGRLLDHVDHAYEARTGSVNGDDPLTEFEETVLFAVAPDPSQPYPPAGHTYPRRG